MAPYRTRDQTPSMISKVQRHQPLRPNCAILVGQLCKRYCWWFRNPKANDRLDGAKPPAKATGFLLYQLDSFHQYVSPKTTWQLFFPLSAPEKKTTLAAKNHLRSTHSTFTNKKTSFSKNPRTRSNIARKTSNTSKAWRKCLEFFHISAGFAMNVPLEYHKNSWIIMNLKPVQVIYVNPLEKGTFIAKHLKDQKTASAKYSPVLKQWHPKRKIIFQPSIFRGEFQAK